MKLCSYCGLPKEKFHNKYYYMCEECGKLYKRYTDLRAVVKNGSIVQANRADKKLMNIVDIYKERAAQGLKVPASLCEYTGELRNRKMLDYCEYCGDTKVFEHSRHKGMCEKCGKTYVKFAGYLNSINALIGAYRCKAAAGYKIPVDIEKYDKLMTLNK